MEYTKPFRLKTWGAGYRAKSPKPQEYYRKAKVYNDGSHFIAIPRSTNPTKRREKPPEELIKIVEPQEEKETKDEETQMEEEILEETESLEECTDETEESDEHKEKYTTKSQLFDEFYEQSRELPKYKRKGYILKRMKPYFKHTSDAEVFVEKKYDDKIRSVIARKTRFIRKAYLNDFNYFVTFTYDDKKHDEQSFRKGVMTCLGNFHSKKGWTYMGVWERAPKTKRLHFHALFNIPEGTMPGKMIEKKDYNLNTHTMQTTKQNSYFNERFGRSDFEEIDKELIRLGNSMAYILKYIDKTGEKLVYSRGLPEFVVTDIMNEDVVCPFGLDDKKLLLFDDFNLWDDGELIGTLTPQTRKRLQTANK